MRSRRGGGLVYSTETGRVCPKCGWPETKCRCSERRDQPLPDRFVAHLRIERAGRSGKTVTVVDGLPANAPFLAALVAELKRACGTGGTVRPDGIELQGDHRATLRPLLAAKGWTVKG